jgi:L-alanine-DL-glutamate epimerase-like enolase superfamily enzyme
MQLHIQTFTVHKRVPLTISRGTQTSTPVVWIQLEHEGLQGWGEACPFTVDEHPQTLEEIQVALQLLAGSLEGFTPWDRQAITALMLEREMPSAARAAVDMALHDWMGKALQVPLWKLWGLDRRYCPQTTVTIGISSPEQAQEQAQSWIERGEISAFKLKLGHPEGTPLDQAMVIAVQEVIPTGSLLTVDANGGWTLEEAVPMCNWLAGQGVALVEQPLEKGKEKQLMSLWHQAALPIFADESCFTSRDIPQLINRIHGINIKLMKSGGLTEALRMIHTARALGLQVMLGCYGHTALANAAAAQLGPLVDYLDLDSHLNLVDDPFIGPELQQGYLMPSDQPGLGVKSRA